MEQLEIKRIDYQRIMKRRRKRTYIVSLLLIISILGIIANLILAGVKIIIGVMSGSIAITSDAVNNLTDSSTALITIIGTKLAQKKPEMGLN